MLPRIGARNAKLLPVLRPGLLTFGIFPRGTAAVSGGRFARNRVMHNLQSYRRERAMIGEHLGAHSWPSAEPSLPKRPAFASSSARRACPSTPADSLSCRDGSLHSRQYRTCRNSAFRSRHRVSIFRSRAIHVFPCRWYLLCFFIDYRCRYV